MKESIFNLIIAVLEMIAAAYRAAVVGYRRFCVKVLWKHFRIKTPAYHRWHDRRAAKLQRELDIAHSFYPSF